MRCVPRRERHVIRACPAAVRGLLERLERGPELADLTEEERDCTLLVLAEALNNVVEHGYRGHPGWIGVLRGARGSGRDWHILDKADAAPEAASMRPDMPGAGAEGGFGWPLILALTEEVALRRRRGFNVLSLRMRGEGPARVSLA